MNNLQNTYQSLAEEKGLDLIIRPTNACTRSDPMLLERVLSNLVSNAIRYTPSGGVVYVVVRPRGQEWLVQVRDNGPGISPEEQDNIFQEFVQLSNPQRDRSQGLGLGLAIVKRLMHLLSHRVAVRSALGQGATFSVYIPKIELGQPTAPTTADTFKTSMDPFSQLKGLRVLVIEDDEMVRQSFQGLLAMWGASVDVFEQAELAIQHATRPDHRPDLIITDHRLGGVAQRARTVSRNCPTAVSSNPHLANHRRHRRPVFAKNFRQAHSSTLQTRQAQRPYWHHPQLDHSP
jgi:CheY-like chemotaxis protein